MPTKPKKSYDPACYELAEIFLYDHPHLATTERIEALAQEIQDAIEAFITHEQSNYQGPEPGGFEGGFADNH